jgi:hypothetical protein
MIQIPQLETKHCSYSATLSLLARFTSLNSTRANPNSELLQLLNSLSYHVDR